MWSDCPNDTQKKMPTKLCPIVCALAKECIRYRAKMRHARVPVVLRKQTRQRILSLNIFKFISNLLLISKWWAAPFAQSVKLLPGRSKIEANTAAAIYHTRMEFRMHSVIPRLSHGAHRNPRLSALALHVGRYRRWISRRRHWMDVLFLTHVESLWI